MTLIAMHLRAGLLLSAIRDPDPVVFFEAKMQYRTVSEEVPTGDYMIPLGQARIIRSGSDITLVGWGQQVAVLERAVGAIILSLIPRQPSSPAALNQHTPSSPSLIRSAQSGDCSPRCPSAEFTRMPGRRIGTLPAEIAV